jgi:hypothetical protein
MTRCQPIRLRQLDSSRAAFSVRCGSRVSHGWRAVRSAGGLDIIEPRGGPRLNPRTVDALRMPVYIAWMVRSGVGKWPG